MGGDGIEGEVAVMGGLKGCLGERVLVGLRFSG